MRRTHFGIALGLCLMVAVSANAAPITSDNFDDGVRGAQWDAASTMVEGGGVATAAVGSSSSNVYQTATGYSLTGDFDVTVDLKVASYSANTVTDWRIMNYMCLTSNMNLGTASDVASLHYRTDDGSNWYARAFMKTNSGAFTYASSAIPLPNLDPQLRVARTGSILTCYIRPQAGGAWTTVMAKSGVAANDFGIILGTVTNTGATVTSQYDNLVVPEPATMGLLATGGVVALIRRRRK